LEPLAVPPPRCEAWSVTVTAHDAAQHLQRRARDARLQSEAVAATTLARVVEAVRSHLPAGAHAWLIGSLAWGGFGLGSDVDLVVDGIDGPTRLKLEEVVGHVASAPVDLLELDTLPAAFRERIERQGLPLHEDVPDGPSWHRELLAQMRVEVPGVRPALLPSSVTPDLEEVRKFRHFFRNAYAVELDPGHVRRQAARVSAIHGPAIATLRGLVQHLERTRDALVSHD